MPAGVAVVGVANRKGGVGKTTIAVNLAATFAVAGRHVVLLDADPQGSATEWAQQRRWRDRFPVTPAKITTVSNFVGTVERLGLFVELAQIERRHSLPDGAALGLFALGRTAGWIAHIFEQRQTGRLIRPRAAG